MGRNHLSGLGSDRALGLAPCYPLLLPHARPGSLDKAGVPTRAERQHERRRAKKEHAARVLALEQLQLNAVGKLETGGKKPPGATRPNTSGGGGLGGSCSAPARLDPIASSPRAAGSSGGAFFDGSATAPQARRLATGYRAAGTATRQQRTAMAGDAFRGGGGGLPLSLALQPPPTSSTALAPLRRAVIGEYLEVRRSVTWFRLLSLACHSSLAL